jgi:hypothetical protein
MMTPNVWLEKMSQPLRRNMLGQPTKPKLGLKAIRLFYRIAAYCARYEPAMKDEYSFRSAASDVMDGTYLGSDKEVKELTRKGIIRGVRLKGAMGGRTWELTDYGMSLIRDYPNPRDSPPRWRKRR